MDAKLRQVEIGSSQWHSVSEAIEKIDVAEHS